jgi:hypothetical protein
LPAIRAAEEGFAAAVSNLVGMPLSDYVLEGQPFEVRVPWWPETLCGFPTPPTRGHSSHPVCREGGSGTTAEIADVVRAGLDPGALRLVQVAKEEFDGQVVAIHPRQSGGSP